MANYPENPSGQYDQDQELLASDIRYSAFPALGYTIRPYVNFCSHMANRADPEYAFARARQRLDLSLRYAKPSAQLATILTTSKSKPVRFASRAIRQTRPPGAARRNPESERPEAAVGSSDQGGPLPPQRPGRVTRQPPQSVSPRCGECAPREIRLLSRRS